MITIHYEKCSRRASIGLIGAAPMNTAAINQNMTEVEESPETLQNIMRVTRDQESVFKVQRSLITNMHPFQLFKNIIFDQWRSKKSYIISI